MRQTVTVLRQVPSTFHINLNDNGLDLKGGLIRHASNSETTTESYQRLHLEGSVQNNVFVCVYRCIKTR
ncbi:hypothetical protein BaRGS_00000608, partial [Batillaria attramentaria]